MPRALCRVACVVVLVAPLAGGGHLRAIEAPAGGPPISAGTDAAPLIKPEHLLYEGAFRLPRSSGENTFEYGGTALTYSVERDSLFLVGHDWHQRVAEIAIPQVVNASTRGALATATWKQGFADVLEGRLGRVGTGTAKIGGLLSWGGSLVATAFLYYDATGSQTTSHFRSALDFSQIGEVQGSVRVGTERAGFVAGHMTPIPPEWQAALGGPAFTGQCCLSIISRTSYGPALSVFDPADVGTKDPVPATPVLGYPEDHATLGAWNTQSVVFNGSTQMAGVAFPSGSRSVLFFGRHGTGPFCYGTGGASGGVCYDPTDSSQGTHAYPYVYQVWAYDVLDLIAVRNGQKKRWDFRPYQVWTLTLPFASESRHVGGVGYDPDSGRIFVSTGSSDGAQPLIHVFRVASTPTPFGPFGAVDTPLDGSGGVTGSIAVTGWALDDRRVTRVRVMRDPVAGEPPGSAIFLGDAVLVAGARPDVALSYQSWPFSTRAGWGYLLLTNMLPNRGNGTFRLHIDAEDGDGHVTRLGSRTITCTNASAEVPFGAIDAPAQGQTISGSAFVNFGWALTPMPKSIPGDGSTIAVYIDGVAVGRPSYNHYRADIADLFPGLNNSQGAIGAFTIDTTTLANGVHTISWGVTDSAGRTEGIGSRYFTVMNGSGVARAEALAHTGNRLAMATGVIQPWGGPFRAAGPEPIFMQSGYGDEPATILAPDAAGRRHVTIKERDRLVLHLGAAASETLRAFVQVGPSLDPTPIGSSLDVDRGILSWQPGLAFIGRYDLLFVRTAHDGTELRVPVSVTLEAR